MTHWLVQISFLSTKKKKTEAEAEAVTQLVTCFHRILYLILETSRTEKIFLRTFI